MTIQLPSNRLGIKQIQLAKRNVPLDQIISIESQNPLATGIETAGNVIGQAIQQRAALRQQGQQLAQIQSITGKDLGQQNSLTPELALQAIRANSEGKKKPYGEPFKGADGKSYGYFYDGNTGNVFVEELPLGLPPPKPTGTPAANKKQSKGVSATGESVYFDPLSGQNMSDGRPYSGPIFPTTFGTEEQRRSSLVNTGIQSIGDVRKDITPEVLQELKLIRLSPYKAYSQLASAEAKKVYTNLKRAMENEVYLRTGATANPDELENSVINNMAALGDNPEEFAVRMDLLERSINGFNQRRSGNGLKPMSPPKPTAITPGTVDGYVVKVKK